ncbi:hypothetical protein B0H13DRAFT_2510299 [Mycena leptocephala]|nr:hypothetical protein B0H13DRAFT_2510299 [Mycena leptocephala]
MSATNIPELIAESLPGSGLGREGQADSSTEDKSKTEAESPEPQPSLVDTIHTVSKTPELKTQPLQDSNGIKEIHLFAGNLPFQMDDSGLFFLFSNNRIHVSWAKVKKDANGNSKGIGIVSVSAHDKEEALSGSAVCDCLQKKDASFSRCALKGTLAAPSVAMIF